MLYGFEILLCVLALTAVLVIVGKLRRSWAENAKDLMNAYHHNACRVTDRVTATVLAIIAIISVMIAHESEEADYGTAFFIAATFIFVAEGVWKGPTKYGQQLLVFGRRRSKCVKKEGYRFWPLRRIVCDFKLQSVQGVDFDMGTIGSKDDPPQRVKTPDDGFVDVPVAITYGIFDPVAYANNGGEEGVKDMLKDMKEARLREWGISSQEGPQTWRELLAAPLEATNVILKAIVDEDQLPRLPRNVPGHRNDTPTDLPTTVLLKYFDSPSKDPTPSEATQWGTVIHETDPITLKDKVKFSWEGGKLSLELAKLSSDQRKVLEKAVQLRRKLLQDVRRGDGDLKVSSLGILIERLNVKDAQPDPELAKKAQAKLIEVEERESEKIELQHFRDRVLELMEKPPKGPGLNKAEATEAVQLTLGKIKEKTVSTQLHKYDLTPIFKQALLEAVEIVFAKRGTVAGGNRP